MPKSFFFELSIIISFVTMWFVKEKFNLPNYMYICFATAMCVFLVQKA